VKNGHDFAALLKSLLMVKRCTCGVIDNFREKDVYPLLPVEILHPSEFEFFNYDAKYSGKSKEICLGNFSKKESDEIQRVVVETHKMLGLRHYSRSGCIVHSKRGVYILLPGPTKESLFPKSLEVIFGSCFDDGEGGEMIFLLSIVR
jgi:D-alanine-D-alanine ligase